MIDVVKMNFSVCPWRLVHRGAILYHGGHHRKRDAVATRDKLLAAADWSVASANDWSEEEKQRIKAIFLETDSYKIQAAAGRTL